ncbi:MAG: glycosyltransferase family 9 protein [Candidatus Omnitrophica bacterium]|nr:glycosyltransferase family 9 protein [Candidatus Omnitrophota bacterium]
MPLDRSKIHNILLITLSNIGDVILTLPVFDVLSADFPDADISILVGPRAKELFSENRSVSKLYVYDKHAPVFRKLKLIGKLRKAKFDLVIDLRHTIIPFLIASPTSINLSNVQKNLHMKDKHLNQLCTAYEFEEFPREKKGLDIGEKDVAYVQNLFRARGGADRYVVIVSGAADHRKRWSADDYTRLADHLAEKYRVKIIFAGGVSDMDLTEQIIHDMKYSAINLCGQLTLLQLAYVIKQAVMVIGNDTGPLHIASYFDVPVLALFGPTDPSLYGPWGANGLFLKSKAVCLACQKKNNKIEHGCMKNLHLAEVIKSFEIKGREVKFSM